MSDSDDPNPSAEIPNIEELLARFAPPSSPSEALDFAPDIRDLVAALDPIRTIAIFAGLMTDPRFQAHQIRLDYAVRIILSTAQGNRRPKSDEVNQLLNTQLALARVARLEDPIEDFFVESLPTHEGEFLIFSGGWEKASIHTEMILEAFGNLPSGEPKIRAQQSASALLKLSTALVQRAELQRGVVGAGTPNGAIPIPSDARLASLASRIRFSASDLHDIGISEDDLRPFFFRMADTSSVLLREPGDSALEFRPLLKTKHGLIVAVPANVSTAVRSLLIDTALKYRAEEALHLNLLRAKGELLVQNNFRPIPGGAVQLCDDQLYCESTTELSAGRFLHVILSVDGFEGWPHRAFGSVRQCSAEWVAIVVSAMRRAKAAAVANVDFVEGMTLWIHAGWGAGRSFAFTPDDDLNDWMFAGAEPADIATMTACEDGKISDIWRLQSQLRLVEQQGFDFFSINGLLNLFHWWRTTDHALVPPQQIDIIPPVSINFDTNLLLDARREAFETFDRRAFRDEQGRWHLVARLERENRYQALQNVYASLDDVRKRKLSGVVVENGSYWWIKLNNIDGEHTEDIYETWRTVLIWAGQIMPPFLASVRSREVVDTIGFILTIEPFPEGHDFIKSKPLLDSEIEAAIELSADPAMGAVQLRLKANWFIGFYRVDNFAERALAVSLLRGACRIFGIERSAEDLHSLVLSSAGSVDFRHRHAFQVERAIDHLAASGLTRTFTEIPKSAGALAKCGSAWMVHPRGDGVRIEGKEGCLALIRKFVETCQMNLLADIRPYRRTEFVVLALEGLQSAIAEEGHWRRSARALRAIQGVDKDFELSLSRAMAANGVLRANSMLCELAAVEAAAEGGRTLGKMDMENLQARALQLFQTADNYPAFLVDRIEPVIHLSPTGDILYQHDFHEAAIERNAKERHARERSDSSEEYLKRFEAERPRPGSDIELERAILSEYGVPIEVFREFAVATAVLARRRNEGVMLLPRSDFISGFREIDALSKFDFSPLIDRLTMPVRTEWSAIPPGCTARDFDLSKFDRRFSLIARPIVALSADDNPTLAIAPGVIERTLVHNIGGALHGTLQNEFWKSADMRSYAGASGARIGVEFNENLARRLSSLGLSATPSAKPWACLNQKKTKEVERLGDIDVLVISGNQQSVWVCEAKDLKLCRTLGEAANRLSEYRGQMKDGKPDKLLRHLQRVNYLRTNAAQLEQRLGLSSTPAVHGIVIVNSPQPMQQLTGEYSKDSTVVMLDDIQNIPWTTGW